MVHAQHGGPDHKFYNEDIQFEHEHSPGADSFATPLRSSDYTKYAQKG